MNNKLAVTGIDVMGLGEVLARSGFFSDTRDAAQAVVKVLAGQELGFGPVASMTGINIIKGRVTISANLMAAAIKRSGKYNYRIVEHSDAVCELEFSEDGKPVGASRFTMDDAKTASLSGDNWKKYPRNMLFARALSNGAKWYTPDIFGGPIYTPDELGAEVNEDGEVINGTVYDIAPAPHWTQDTSRVHKAEQWLGSMGLSDEDANIALDVDDWRQTALSAEHFKAAIEGYVEQWTPQASASDVTNYDPEPPQADSPPVGSEPKRCKNCKERAAVETGLGDDYCALCADRIANQQAAKES